MFCMAFNVLVLFRFDLLRLLEYPIFTTPAFGNGTAKPILWPPNQFSNNLTNFWYRPVSSDANDIPLIKGRRISVGEPECVWWLPRAHDICPLQEANPPLLV